MRGSGVRGQIQVRRPQKELGFDHIQMRAVEGCAEDGCEGGEEGGDIKACGPGHCQDGELGRGHGCRDR
jgi:hypothetical protein